METQKWEDVLIRFSRLAINEVHNSENLRSFNHFSRLAINEVHNGGNFHR